MGNKKDVIALKSNDVRKDVSYINIDDMDFASNNEDMDFFINHIYLFLLIMTILTIVLLVI